MPSAFNCSCLCRIFHTVFSRVTVDPSIPIEMLALRDRKSFQSMLTADRTGGKDQLELAGYFMPTAQKDYILLRLDAPGEHPFETVYHEFPVGAAS